QNATANAHPSSATVTSAVHRAASIAERNALFQCYPRFVPTVPSPLSGRRAQAARNDELILDSARAVFLADPAAPISEVAKHAGVGISALYSRYASKEELLRKLCNDGLQRFIDETERAVADDRDP